MRAEGALVLQGRPTQQTLRSRVPTSPRPPPLGALARHTDAPGPGRCTCLASCRL
jgi:hypothetical protein